MDIPAGETPEEQALPLQVREQFGLADLLASLLQEHAPEVFFEELNTEGGWASSSPGADFSPPVRAGFTIKGPATDEWYRMLIERTADIVPEVRPVYEVAGRYRDKKVTSLHNTLEQAKGAAQHYHWTLAGDGLYAVVEDISGMWHQEADGRIWLCLAYYEGSPVNYAIVRRTLGAISQWQ